MDVMEGKETIKTDTLDLVIETVQEEATEGAVDGGLLAFFCGV